MTAPEEWRVTKAAVADAGGVVAAQQVAAARAGARMLAEGGNAVDAAVAAALALAPVEPWMCGLGGSGFLVAWIAAEGRAVALDFQGVLAAGLDPADYPVDEALPRTSMGFPAVRGFANTQGYGAVTVPGAVAGLSLAAARWGRLGFGRLLGPAIDLAETGLPASWYATLVIASEARILARDPVSAAIYLPGGAPLAPGERLRIPGLADTLRTLRDEGPDSFYRGALARRIAADLAAGGSRITAEDLAAYAVADVVPLAADHRGARLHTPGPHSGGLRLADFLAHVAAALADPPERPTPETWEAYAAALEAAWRAHRARMGTLAEVGASTSALAAADAAGNMAAITYTLLDHFGAGVTLPTTGIAMNNAVSYFDPRPGRPTSMAAGARIASSNMCPTVAVRDGRAAFALGASGGDLIMPAVAQIAALMLDFRLSLSEAMHSPRLDASHRGTVRADPRLGPAVLARLAARWPLEVAPNVVMPKLYASPSGVAAEAGGLVGLNDPVLPDGGAAGPSPAE